MTGSGTLDGCASFIAAVPADVRAVADVRRRAVEAVQGWGGANTFALESVVEELLVNAIEHTRSPPILRVARIDDRRVRVEVTDQRPEAPSLAAPYDRHTRGLGLRIVDALSEGWGADTSPTSKVVWAVVPVTGQ